MGGRRNATPTWRVNKLFDDLWQEPVLPKPKQEDMYDITTYVEVSQCGFELCRCQGKVELVDGVKEVVIEGEVVYRGTCSKCGLARLYGVKVR